MERGPRPTVCMGSMIDPSDVSAVHCRPSLSGPRPSRMTPAVSPRVYCLLKRLPRCSQSIHTQFLFLFLNLTKCYHVSSNCGRLKPFAAAKASTSSSPASRGLGLRIIVFQLSHTRPASTEFVRGPDVGGLQATCMLPSWSIPPRPSWII